MSPRKVLIVGAGLAGSRCAEVLRAEGFAGEVVLAGDEAHPPYERPALSKELLAGRRDDVALRPERVLARAGDRTAPRRPASIGSTSAAVSPDTDAGSAQLGRARARDRRTSAAPPGAGRAARGARASHAGRRSRPPLRARPRPPPGRRRRRLRRHRGRLDRRGRWAWRSPSWRPAALPFAQILGEEVGRIARRALPLGRSRPPHRGAGRVAEDDSRAPARAPARLRHRGGM